MKYQAISRRKFLKAILAAGSAATIDWAGMGALASEIKDKQQFPVVVIGAGLGGLVSAAYLSRNGFPVTLIEQHDIPGGYATSFDRKKGRFTFDVSLHATVAENAMPQKILSDLGIWEKLTVAYTPELRRIITPDFDVTLPAKNPDGVKKALSKIFPHEQKGIVTFYSQMEQVIRELWNQDRFEVSMMDALSKITLEDWMSMHVTDPDVKYCLSAFSGYYGKLPRDINALFYAIATGEYLVFGGQYYKTRSQDLSDALADAVDEAGGQILYKTLVERILFSDDGMVKGVLSSDGRHHPAKAVVANCSVPVLLDSMIPPKIIPEPYYKKVKASKPSVSSFVVWLGLNTGIDAIKDYEIDIRQSSHYQTHLIHPGDLALSDIGITIYDNLFKGYSVPGTSTLSIIALTDYASWETYETDYFNGNKQAYNREKLRIAGAFIQKVEQTLIPGLKDMIEVMEVGTPLTNKRYTGNPGGAIYGFDTDTGKLKVKTPIKGIYLAGAWTGGGGYTPAMMSGRDAAAAVIKDFKSL